MTIIPLRGENRERAALFIEEASTQSPPQIEMAIALIKEGTNLLLYYYLLYLIINYLTSWTTRLSYWVPLYPPPLCSSLRRSPIIITSHFPTLLSSHFSLVLI